MGINTLAWRVAHATLDLTLGILVCRTVGRHDTTWVPREGRWERRCRLCGKLTATWEAS